MSDAKLVLDTNIVSYLMKGGVLAEAYAPHVQGARTAPVPEVSEKTGRRRAADRTTCYIGRRSTVGEGGRDASGSG